MGDATGDEITPFRVEVGDDAVDDLRARLARTRWPERETVDGWAQGVPLAFAQRLCGYWADGYDFAAAEARFNRFPQFRTRIDGLGLHFLHVRSPEPDALPLVVTHGWPGSVVEFHDVIGPLTDPVAHGGDPADAFHVVCPSLPGYGWSDRPTAPGWGLTRIAAAWSELMARLGYGDRFGAQGGDWGAGVTTALGRMGIDGLVGIHLNMPPVPFGPRDELETDEERRAYDDYTDHLTHGTGYSRQQSTRPQTIGYPLVDSPSGLAAWIVEKFWNWTDCDGDPLSLLTEDQLLDNVLVYWLTATGASAARLYWESFRDQAAAPVTVPVGCSIFPREIRRPSRRLAERRFTDIRYWNELDKGGHFAALEQPELYVDEVRKAFRLFR